MCDCYFYVIRKEEEVHRQSQNQPFIKNEMSIFKEPIFYAAECSWNFLIPLNLNRNIIDLLILVQLTFNIVH